MSTSHAFYSCIVSYWIDRIHRQTRNNDDVDVDADDDDKWLTVILTALRVDSYHIARRDKPVFLHVNAAVCVFAAPSSWV